MEPDFLFKSIPDKCRGFPYCNLHGCEHLDKIENHDCHSEINAWRTIVKEGKFEIVKELGSGVRRFYVLNDGYTKIKKNEYESSYKTEFDGLFFYDIANKEKDQEDSYSSQTRGWNLLIIAAYHGNVSLFQEVFQLVDDKNPQFGGWPFTNALHTAARFGHSEICQLILDNQEDKNPSHTHPTVGSVLHVSAEHGNFEVFKLVFDQVKEKNPTDGPYQLTPLHNAAENGHYEVCKLILESVQVS